MKRIWKIIIAVAVIAAVSLWVKSRWRAWFRNVPEMEYAAALTPDRITLTPGADFDSERTVSWRCGDAVATSSLLLAHHGDTLSVACSALQPGCPVTVTLHHADGSTESILAQHTYNQAQIAWFKAGSALGAMQA